MPPEISNVPDTNKAMLFVNLMNNKITFIILYERIGVILTSIQIGDENHHQNYKIAHPMLD